MERDLDRYPVVIEQSVTWGDMDANGHVNNVEYFRYMENARVEYYRRIGKFEFERQTGITLVLKSTTCNYVAPLAYPDRITVGARVKEISARQMIMTYVVMDRERNTIAALGEAAIVALNMKDKTKVPVPEAFKRRIRDLQGEMK